MIVASHMIVFLITAFASTLPFSFASNVSKGKGPTEDVRYVSEQPHLLEALVELEEALAEVKDEERVSQDGCRKERYRCYSDSECCSGECDYYYTRCQPENLGREIGVGCRKDDDCHSRNCGNGECRQNEYQERCWANKDCFSYKCESWMNNTWVHSPWTICAPEDKECEKDSDCPSRMCYYWKCLEKDIGMRPCEHDDNCISGKCHEIKKLKQCEKTKAGTFCYGYWNCLSNKCENNICA